MILQRVQSPTAPPSPKLARTDLPSDDEVEVVTEWLAPPVKEGRGDMPESTSSPLHVPVIQRSADAKTTTAQDRDKVSVRLWRDPISLSAASRVRADGYVRAPTPLTRKLT